jgi:hypothetical protein
LSSSSPLTLLLSSSGFSLNFLINLSLCITLFVSSYLCCLSCFYFYLKILSAFSSFDSVEAYYFLNLSYSYIFFSLS